MLYKKPFALLVVIITSCFFISGANALSIGLRCMMLSELKIREYVYQQLKLRNSKRDKEPLIDRMDRNATLLAAQQDVLNCINKQIKDTKRNADCSGLQPPNLLSIPVEPVNLKIIGCHELMETGIKACLKNLSYLKKEARFKFLSNCTNNLEKKVIACSRKYLKGTLISKTPERPLVTNTPIWYSKASPKEGDTVYACVNNKANIPRWRLGKWVASDGVYAKLKLRNGKTIKVPRVQLISSEPLKPYYKITSLERQNEQRRIINQVLYQLFPLVVARLERKSLPKFIDKDGYIKHFTAKEGGFVLDFNEKKLHGRLSLIIWPEFSPVDRRPSYLCRIIRIKGDINLPSTCQMKKV